MRYPITKLIAVVTKIVKMSKVPKTEPPPKRTSTPMFAITTGADIKKLRFNDWSWLYFSNRIVETVNPEREMPGRMAIP